MVKTKPKANKPRRKLKTSKALKKVAKIVAKEESKPSFFRRVANAIPKGSFAAIGSAMAPIFGAPPSSGASLGSLVSSITGIGAYRVTPAGEPFSVPVFPKSSDGGFRIQRKEYIGDVSSSIGFVVNSYPLQPGMPNLFPWLSTFAPNFEEYRIHGAAISFKSTAASALNSTNTALGTVIVAAQYDSYDVPFGSKLEMENYEGSVSCKPAENLIFGLECDRRKDVATHLYTRTGASSGDIRLYDLANISVATVGSQAVAVIGELWITYDITLYKPKLTLSPSQTYWAHSYKTSNFTVANSITNVYDTSSLITGVGSSTKLTITSTSSNVSIRFANPGNYMIWSRLVAAAVPSVSFNNNGPQTNGGVYQSTSAVLGTTPWYAPTQSTNPNGEYYATASGIVNALGPITSSMFAVNVLSANTLVSFSAPNTVSSVASTVAVQYDLYVLQVPTGISMPAPSIDDKFLAMEKQIKRLSCALGESLVIV